MVRNRKLSLLKSFPLRFLPSIPGPRSAHSPNFTHYLVQGGLRRQLQGYWLHGAPPSQDVLEAALGMGEGLWVPRLAPPSRAAPLKPQVISWPLCANPPDSPPPPDTSREHSPAVLEPRRVAQLGGPAPAVPFGWCPAGSGTLDMRRGRRKESNYEKGTSVSWASVMCQDLWWVFS